MSARDYFQRASEVTGLLDTQLRGESRRPRHVRARWALMRALDRSGMSTAKIGYMLNRDRTTVMYGVEQAERLIPTDPDFAALCAAVEGT